MTEATTVADREVAEFLAAVSGPPGSLDAWLKLNGEAELRAHILAVVNGAERTIMALQTGCTQWQVSAEHAREELDEAIELLQAFFAQVIDDNHYPFVFVQMQRELRDRIGAFLEKNNV